MEKKMNSLEKSLKKWQEQQGKYEDLFSPAVTQSKDFKHERLRQLMEIVSKLTGAVAALNRPVLQILKTERKKLELEVYGKGMLKRFIFRAFDSRKVAKENKVLQKHSEVNAAEIADGLRKMGFPQLIDQVKAQMKQGKEEILAPIAYQLTESLRMEVAVQIKTDEQGRYQITQFKAALKQPGLTGEKREHVFKNEAGQPFTAMQARNLLAGRAVKTDYFVEGSRHSVWTQFDLNDKRGETYVQKCFDENYGYNLKKELDKLPLAVPLTAEKRAMVLRELEEGKKVPLVLNQGMQEKTVYIQANPGKRNVELLNAQGTADKRNTAVIRKMNVGLKTEGNKSQQAKVKTMPAAKIR